MAYEPLTPYKSKDDPLWYVFDEEQNFKTFDTRGKAMEHIRRIKFPLNESIDLDTAYSPKNKKIVQNRNARIDSFNLAEGNDVSQVEAISIPKKIKPEFREVKNINAVREAVGALEKGTRRFGGLVVGGGSKGLSEPWINSPYGYSLGDKDLNTKDVNHKEYLEAKKYFDSIKPDLMSKGEFTHENVNKLLKEKGFKNSRLSNTGTLWTELSSEQQNENLEKSIIHTYASEFENFVMKNPLTVESWDQIEDSYVNMFFETIPNVGGIIGASMINPALGMSVAGAMMAGESWTLAEPYIQSGKISPSDAGDMAMLVGASSMLLNYLPATVWSSNPILKKQFEKALFDKLSKKQIYKHFNKTTAKEIFTEAVTESIDENILMYGESQYRDISANERSQRSLLAFSMGATVSTAIGGSLNWANKNQLSKIFNESENIALPSFMKIDKSGNISFNVKEENYKSKEDYKYVKEIVSDPELKKRLNPSKLIKKYPDVPVNLVVFHELISSNPNLADVEVNFDISPKTEYMTEQELIEKNEDPNSPQWEKVLVKKGEYLYNENEKTYKVYKGGSNILNDTNGVINLTQGANQDVYVEEITELLYKKLKTTNPKLRKKIDTWIADMTKVLNDNGAGGPRNIELFSKFYTFNYMGYKSDVYDLSDIVVIPQDILNEFDSIMGEQENGPNISFMFQGSEPNLIKEKNVIEETDVDETSQTVETPEESFRLSPNKFSDIEIEVIKTKIQKGYIPLDTELEKYYIKSWIGNINVTKELDRLHNLYLRSQNKNLKDDQKNLLEKVNNLRSRLNLSDPLGYDDVDVTTISDELGLTLNDALDKGIITEEERTNLAKFVQGKPIPKKLDTIKPPENIDEIVTKLKDKYADKVVEGLKSWEQSSEQSFRIEPVSIGETKGTFFISGDPVNLNLEGEQEDFGIRYPDTNKGWAVTKGPATRIKNEIAKGNNVIVITAMSDVKGSMLKNPSYLKQLDLATIKKVGKREFNKLMKELNNDSYKVAVKAKVNTIDVAKKTAVPDFNQIAGKIVAVATVKDIRTDADRKVNHPAYPYEINFDTYYRLPEPIDFKTFLKDLPDYKNKEGKTVSRSQFGQIMASTYNLSVLRNESELNSQLIDFALTGEPETLGVETEAMQFASPQIKEIGLEDAIKSINNESTRDFHRNVADLEVALEIESNTKQAVGKWDTGAEPTIVTEITKKVSTDKLEFLGSMKGLLKEQLSVLNFVSDPKGPHNLLKINLGFDISQINKYTKKLEEMGIEHMTLPITGNKFDLIVVDMDGKVLNLIRKNNYEDETEITKGRATFLGDDTRGKAEQKFLEIYRKNSKKYPEVTKIFNKIIADNRPRFDLNKLKSDKSNRLTPSFSEVQQKYIDTREFFISKIQDDLRRLKVIQEKIGDIPEEQDAYMRAELYIGKASEKIENFRTKEIEPLVKQLTDDGFTIEDIGDYLYARHSKERNKLISERTDGEVKDGSGMSDKDITLDDGTVIEGSKTILNKFKNTKIKDYAKKVDTIINKTLDVLYDGELITKEDYDYYKSSKMFKNYVPLKGLPGDETYFASGKGFSVTGKDIKRAKGRGSRANNPFVQVLADYEQAIVRSEKNKVGIAFYNLVENNPSEMWEAKGLKHLPRFDKNGEVQYLDPMQLRPNEIEVKVEGKRKIVTINDADLVRQMKNMGSSQPLKGLITFNNFFRAINTTLNPEFIITNFSRDLQAGLFNLNADHKGLTKKVLKYIFKAQKGIWTNIRGGKSEWASIYQEYKDNGGKVGWFEQETIDQKTEKLKKVLKTAQSKNQFGTAFRSVGKFVNDANEMVESGVRLATYKALVEAGVTPKKSAQYSKNLTVNFNKKGEWGSAINSIWVFSNASIQGTTRVIGMGSTKRGKLIMGGLIAMGFLQSFINRMTDSEDWEQFDDYVKDNYWMYLLPNGKALSIKAPYGYNVFKVMGSLLEEMIFGDTTLPEASKRFIVSVNDAFNPVGGGSLLQAISPTITDPFVQIVENKNFFGGPIMPEQPAYQPKIADKKRYFPSARKQSKVITNWLNKITGGGEDISGWVDVSPETLDHFFDSYTGGVGKFVANAIESGTSLAVDGKFPSPTNVPIKRQFYKDKSEWVSRKLLRDMVNESKRIKYSAKQKNRLLRHLKYLKESDFDREKYKTKVEWLNYLKKEKEEFFKNQRNIK